MSFRYAIPSNMGCDLRGYVSDCFGKILIWICICERGCAEWDRGFERCGEVYFSVIEDVFGKCCDWDLRNRFDYLPHINSNLSYICFMPNESINYDFSKQNIVNIKWDLSLKYS